jgi:AcrR family transcriptional regulator
MGTGELDRGESARLQILDAVVRLAESGRHSRQPEVAVIAQAAGVTEGVFYEHFADEEEAFLAAFDQSIEIAESLIAAIPEQDQPWVEKLAAAIEASFEVVAAEPARAHLCLVASQSAGEGAVARYRSICARAEEWLKPGRAHACGDHPLPESLETFVVHGLAWLIQKRLVEGQLDGLKEDLPDMVEFALTPYLSDAEAARLGAESAWLEPPPGLRPPQPPRLHAL